MGILETLTSPSDLRALPVDRLGALAAEIRQAICEQVSRTGGHLAPNLGVVELTIALHYVFDFAHDRLLFDVGHQCYPHKLLTGRYPLLGKLRQRDGMAGFPEPAESPYDLFRVGHAGTGISTAVGMARGDALRGEAYHSKSNPDGRRVVTLIGDASIVNGVAMEGLNGAGTLKRQFLVVLNDNGMSISRPQGALAQYFDRVRLSHTYTDFKKSARQVLDHVPGGALMTEAYHRAAEATKAWVKDDQDDWFEKFGLVTVGPIDGHDLPSLIEFLAEAAEMDRPTVLHVKTIKGKGYPFAEGNATAFHSPKPFAAADGSDLTGAGCRVEIRTGGRSFTSAFGEALVDMMQRDPAIVACTAAMPDGTGLSGALERFPERAWDTGICESHAMDMMAGLAKTGYKPFFAVYCTFLQRAFDQAFQEVALQGLPVRLCLDRAGLVGGDGAVHHGFCDVALLRTLPGAALMAAMDEPSLKAALEFMRGCEEGLSAVRYPRDDVSDAMSAEPCPPFELGRARLLRPADGPADVAVLAYGVCAVAALEAAEALAGEYSVAVYDARFAKPVDAALLRQLARDRTPILTVEEHSVIGGFGAAVLEALQEMGLQATVSRLGMPDAWIAQDSRRRQLAEAGLDASGIERAIRAGADGGPAPRRRSRPPRPRTQADNGAQHAASGESRQGRGPPGRAGGAGAHRALRIAAGRGRRRTGRGAGGRWRGGPAGRARR
ncbi:MAG: 1-deoxy-D-xylulose-5-phosphate synthase [Phycisphaerales bacterium JB039]